MKSINPATGQVIKEYRDHTLEECLEILPEVDRAWRSWQSTPIRDRAALMKNLSRQFLHHRQDYAGLMTQEMGKVTNEALAEIDKCALVCDYYAEQAEHMLADEVVATDASRSFVSFEPLGAILAIMPWNYPFWQVCRFAAPALMAGNACILKHAPNVPDCALALEEIFRQAGFPLNVFRSLLIPVELVEPLIAHDVIKGVTLTGSIRAGRQVAAAAGRHLKKSVLELGGSDPFIILADAPLDICCSVALTSRMQNAGQVCISAKRFIVVESIAPEFIARQLELIRHIRVGDPRDEETTMGPLAREDLLLNLQEQVSSSVQMGAYLHTGGGRIDCPGFFYQPTLLTGVKKGMPVYDEETFGPVTVVITVKDETEALAVANDSSYGLGASIWTQDLLRAERLARQVEAGLVVVNSMTKSDPRLPFGGAKKSGYGRELSHYGIKEFMNIKTIWMA